MTPKRAAGLVVCCALWGAPPAWAQTFDQLQIRVEGNIVRSDGGEHPSVGSSSGPLEIGKTTTSGIAKRSPSGCGLHAGPRLPPDAVKGWSLVFTPTRVQGNAVTFHVRWTRVDAGKEAAPVDADLTLRPGESIPIDSLSLTAAATDPPTCRLSGMTLRMNVDYWPMPEREPRLVATDLWLVEKGPDGGERAQQLTARGLPNRGVPFYFAPLTEGGVTVDIYGDLRAEPAGDSVELSLVARSRIGERGQSSTIWRDGSHMTGRKIELTFKVKPGEVVSVELPRLSENQSGAFASKTLSLRVRSQQVR